MADSSLNVIVKLVDQASGGLKSFADKVDATGKSIEDTTGKAQTFTKAVTAVGLAVGTYAVAKFAEYEKTMSGVKAVLTPTGEEFQALGDKVKQLGKDTIYSQGEIAKTTEDLAKNGLNAAQILGGALDATTNFASAAGTNLQTAGNVMSDAMNIFGLSADKAAKAVDQMTGVTIASKFGAEDYSLALAQGGGAAKAAGVSFEDFNTTIAAVSNSFASGSDAGTSFKTFIQRLVPTSDKAAEAMEKIGFNAYDSTGKMKSMKDIAQNLQDGLKGLSDEQRNAALTTIFGSDSMRIAAAVAEKGAEGYDKYAAAIANTNAAEQAKIRLDNLAGSWEALKGTVDLMATNLGEKIGNTLRPAIDALNAALGDMGKWWESLSPGMQEFITIAGTAAAVLAGIVFAVGAIGIAFSVALPAISAVAGAFAFLLSPIGLIVAALAALGVAYATNFGGFRDTVNSAFAAMKPAFDSFVNTLSNVATQVMTYVELIKGPLVTVWDTIKPYVFEFLDTLKTYFSETFTNLITILSGAWDIIKGVFEIAFNVIAGAFTLFFQVLTGDWTGAWETIKTVVANVWDGIKLILSGVLTVIGGLFSQFGTTIKLMFSTLWDGLKTVVGVAATAIKGLVSDLWDGMKNIFKAGQDLVAGGWEGFANGLASVMASVWSGIKSTIAAGINWMIDKVNALIDSINSATGPVGFTVSKIPRVAFQTGGIVPGFGAAFQSGGIISGGKNPASHDKVPAMLDPGELILNRAQQGNLADQMRASGAQSAAPTVVVSVTGNSFFGSDSDFADSVADEIFKRFNTHTAIPGF